MMLQDVKQKEPVVFWTRQAVQVEEELERTGRYLVREEYVRAKNDTISDFYLRLYEWYARTAGRFMHLPADARYPIWFSVSEDLMLQPVPDTIILKVELPADSYVLCNYDAWGYVVNYWYVPVDDADEKKHDAELKRLGIGSDDTLLLTDKGNFFPAQKRQLLSSWNRTFTQMPRDMKAGVVATAFEIRKEWVKEIRHYGE